MLVGYAVLRGPVPRRQHAERPDARGAGLDVLAHEGAAHDRADAFDAKLGPEALLDLRHGREEREERQRAAAGLRLRRRVNIELNFPPNFEGLVLGCINADFCK